MRDVRDVLRVRTGAGVSVTACMPQDQTDIRRTDLRNGDRPGGVACSAGQEYARLYDSDVRNADRRGAGRGISRTRKI